MKNVLKIIFYSLILSLLINIVYIKFIEHNKILSLFGYSSLKVITGSMSPEIEAGEHIIIKKNKDYEVGDIITFIQDNELITHRIISIKDGKIYTKGDANNSNDLYPISLNQIYGKVIYHYHSFIPNPFYTLSKFLDSKKILVSGKIANPIFIVEGEDEINIERYSTINTYTFTVKNYNDSKISEVDLNYNIEIIADKKVEYTLYLGDKKIDTKESFTMKNAKKTEHIYTLQIKAPEDYKGTLKVNVHAYQKEEN